MNNIKYSEQRDEETGLSYFGARYYDSELLTGWLSVDPMADKYPSMSPYSYCAGNPVKLGDPEGMEFGDFYDETGGYLGTDRKNDQKIYQTTRTAWNKHVCNSTSPEITGAAGLVPSKYDNLINNP